MSNPLNRFAATHRFAIPVRALVVAMLFVFVGVSTSITAASAQEILANPEAEAEFAAGLESFEAGNYDAAYQSFRKVVDSYDLNYKTTAARLMAGKALYRMGEYERSIDALKRFVETFPNSKYVASARQTLAFAEEAQDHIEEMGKVKQIGVLLPTSTDDINLTQALFNGFRIAVDQFNDADSDRNLVRMIFSPSTGNMEQAFRDFEDAGVSAVFGPLYSREAIEAAAFAESRGMVLLTPLATDEDVADGKRFVFQGNPTPTMRGRLMAKFAVESLRMTDVGVVGEYDNSLSERMTEGFQDEIERLGAELRFVKMVSGTSGWFRLVDQFESDSLAGLDAIYLPITGGQAQTLIKTALDNIDRLNLPIKLLGNKEWYNLPSKTQPSKYSATYTNDYRVDSSNPMVEAFRSRYAELAGEQPNQLAFVGYDMGRFLLEQVVAGPDDRLVDRFHTAPPFTGLSVKLDFGDGNVNQAMFYERYRNGRIELLR